MDMNSKSSILEYARCHGLAIDHRASELLGRACCDLDPALSNDTPALFEIEDHAFDPLRERLLVSKRIAQILAATPKAPPVPREIDETYRPRTNRRPQLRQELPLLQTDHDEDLRHFKLRIDPSLHLENLPLEEVDDELDEGLEWPSAYDVFPQQIERACRDERLAIPKAVLEYLETTLKGALLEDIPAFDEADFSRCNKRQDIMSISPPLLPLCSSPKPHEPSSDTGRLQLIPDSSSPTADQLNTIEERLLIHEEHMVIEGSHDGNASRRDATDPAHPQLRTPQPHADGDPCRRAKTQEPIQISRDEMLLDAEVLENLYSPFKDIHVSPAPQYTKPKKQQHDTLEVPLTPPKIEVPSWSDDLLNDALRTIAQSAPHQDACSNFPSSPELDAFFAATIEPIATKAAQAIEQEQLQVTDSLGRVHVPPMNFAVQIAPWQKRAQGGTSIERTSSVLSQLRTLKIEHAHWPNVGRLEKELQWAPFPVALARLDMQVTVAGAELLPTLIEMPECVESDSLVWKPDGLRQFDDLRNLDEDELAPGKFPDDMDMKALIRKRKLEIHRRTAGVSDGNGHPLSSSDACAAAEQTIKRHKPMSVSNPEEPDSKNESHHANRGRLCALPLEHFLELRRGTLTEASNVRVQAEAFSNNPDIRTRTGSITGGASRPTDQLASTTAHPTLAMQRITPAPELTVPTTPRPFIVSTRFMQDRKLARDIENLYPAAILIERDFSLHLASSSGGTTAEDPDVHPMTSMHSEADMVVCPTTGIILTTFQKIKQRALPGQGTESAIREHVVRASPRYGKLIVLVTSRTSSDAGDASAATVGLNPEECNVLTEFIAFCAGVAGDVQVYLVSGRSELRAQWVVSLMIRYGMHDPTVSLLQEETQWEVFLRRAGLNPFAAQMVCAAFKKPSLDHSEGVGPAPPYGLKAFVMMPAEARLAKFEHLFGGGKLISRVSDVLDTTWR